MSSATHTLDVTDYPTPASASPRTLRVLIVEDESRLRDMLVRAVTDMGFDAHGAPTAEAALRTLGERPADVAVLDLNLPGMHGMELFGRLRQQQPSPQVIVMTGFGDLESAQQAVHYDAVEFLTKPCALGDLEIALDRARTRATRPAPDSGAKRLTPSPLPPAPATPGPSASAFGPAGAPAKSHPLIDGNTLEAVERRHILAVLEKNGGNRAATAAELGISLRKLYYRLGQYQREGLFS